MDVLTADAQPTWTTAGRLAAELTGTRLDPTPFIDHCSTCGVRRDTPSHVRACLSHPQGPVNP